MKLYRAMTPDSDRHPTVARQARALGVRVDGDVRDVFPDLNGYLRRGGGGMSVAPDDPWYLPAHRRPRRLGRGSTGHDEDFVFSIDETSVETRGLAIRVDAPDRSHALVEPSVAEPLGDYEARLAATRPAWAVDEPR